MSNRTGQGSSESCGAHPMAWRTQLFKVMLSKLSPGSDFSGPAFVPGLSTYPQLTFIDPSKSSSLSGTVFNSPGYPSNSSRWDWSWTPGSWASISWMWTSLVYLALGIEPRPSNILGKHSTKWGPSRHLISSFFFCWGAAGLRQGLSSLELTMWTWLASDLQCSACLQSAGIQSGHRHAWPAPHLWCSVCPFHTT